MHTAMSVIQIQVVSDLHLETPSARPSYTDFHIQPRCQNLALLGDVGHVADLRLLGFLEEQLRRFDTVFYLLGNHDVYGLSPQAARETMQAFAMRMQDLRKRSPQMFVSQPHTCMPLDLLTSTKPWYVCVSGSYET